jgi:hypothetical protein
MVYASRLDIPGDLEAFIMASATAGVGSKAAELRTNANHVPSRGNGTGTRGGRAKGREHEMQATEKPKRRGTFSARVTPIPIEPAHTGLICHSNPLQPQV